MGYYILHRKLSFSEAFSKIKYNTDLAMRLPSWSSEVLIKSYNPKNNDDMSPFLYVDSRNGIVPWKETYPELYSNDWEVVRVKRTSNTVKVKIERVENCIDKTKTKFKDDYVNKIDCNCKCDKKREPKLNDPIFDTETHLMMTVLGLFDLL